MSTEATKTKSVWSKETLQLLQGRGIDIGCGGDPVLPSAECFDLQHGDANRVDEYVTGQYDYVFSSHCLEHMHNPKDAIRRWFKLVKPGGHLIILVPDEDLYEQGCFPSIFNSDHKNTFTISKAKSWSLVSNNLLELANSLNGEIISLELQDFGVDRALCSFHPGRFSKWLGRIFRKLSRWMNDPANRAILAKVFRRFGAVVDQTDLGDLRLAQIQLIMRKPVSS